MLAALIFPPQWDPRQPPLAPALLAGSLIGSGVETRVFDLNIALYRRLLRSATPDGIEDFLLKRLLDPVSLSDAQIYLQICEKVQEIFDERFDLAGYGRLFWDTCRGFPSISGSDGWRAIIDKPDQIPFIRHLECDINDILKWKPDFIGISVISDTQLHATLALASILRREMPDSIIIAGGNAVTYRRTLLPGNYWLKSTFDGLCTGDGEPLMSSLAGSSLFSEASNLIRWNDCCKPLPGISKLHDLSKQYHSEFDILPLNEYLTPHLVMPVETARGCPWGRCAFCIHPVRAATGRALYRPKPMSLVKNEIAALLASGHRRFAIVDEAVPPPRLLELADLFGNLPEEVSWICYVRLDEGHNRKIFAKARAAGCRKLFIGLESGSDRLLKKFNKGVDRSRARRILLDAASVGLSAHLFLMSGFPDESESDRQATLELLSEVLPEFDPFGTSFDLFPLTGELETDMTANPTAYGWAGPTRNNGNDLDWQFPLLSDRKALESLSEFRNQIHALADSILGKAFGLRHASLSQDSLHLLLLEARSNK